MEGDGLGFPSPLPSSLGHGTVHFKVDLSGVGNKRKWEELEDTDYLRSYMFHAVQPRRWTSGTFSPETGVQPYIR